MSTIECHGRPGFVQVNLFAQYYITTPAAFAQGNNIFNVIGLTEVEAPLWPGPSTAEPWGIPEAYSF